MKTVTGHCVSSKDISLSKAAKILSKFVSADNGASHVINAYLHRASESFNELNQLHKELESSHSRKKHKRHHTETDNHSRRIVETSVRSVDAKLPNGVQNELASGSKQGNEEQVNPGMEEGRKQKSAKKHKVSTNSFSNYKDEVENGKELEQQQKEIEKKQCNGVGGQNRMLGGSLDIQIKKKKKYEKGSENTLDAEEVKLEQSKNRKTDSVEERPEDPTGDLIKKKRKKKFT